MVVVEATPTIRQEFDSFLGDLFAGLRSTEKDHDGLPDAEQRTDDISCVLCYHEQRMREALNEAGIRRAYDNAVWASVWQLRQDVLAACDRAAKAQHEARWARDE